VKLAMVAYFNALSANLFGGLVVKKEVSQDIW
jgi:hypothetical protein